MGSTRARGLHYVAATPQAALATGLLQCQIRRGLDDSGSRTATSAAPIVDQERSRGTRRPANWRVLLAGALPVVIGKTAGVPGLHAERLWWVRAVVESAAGRGFETAHKRVRVRDVGRLVRPSEADPVYLSYERPCLRINRSRHLKWRILETVSPPCWTHLRVLARGNHAVVPQSPPGEHRASARVGLGRARRASTTHLLFLEATPLPIGGDSSPH